MSKESGNRLLRLGFTVGWANQMLRRALESHYEGSAPGIALRLSFSKIK